MRALPLPALLALAGLGILALSKRADAAPYGSIQAAYAAGESDAYPWEAFDWSGEPGADPDPYADPWGYGDGMGEPVTPAAPRHGPATGTRGERNNNPGNLRSGVPWIGVIGADSAGFAIFDTPEHGIRAIGVNLRAYGKRGIRTVAGIINRYAPPTENDTGAYARAVARALGVAADAPLNMDDPDTITALVAAIIQHENGRTSYAAETIAAASMAAFG